MNNIKEKQKEFYKTGKTISYEFRLNALKRLKEAIINNEDKIYEAVYNDLNKSKGECFMTEVGLILSDLNYQIKHLGKFMKPKKVKTPLSQFKSKSFISPHPYGNVLIISPWNYPILLSLGPLIGAIASGNTIILKPSEYSPHTSNILKEIISNTFDEKYISVILGDKTIASSLLEEKWDYIFFTGGIKVGKLVYESASKNLTPITLEYYLNQLSYIITHVKPNFIIHRITGDAPKDLLIAPEWNSHKKWVLNGFEKILKEKDLWQGKFYNEFKI